MSLAGFDDAFSAIADVAKKAASLPDHRERSQNPIDVQTSSGRGEVRVRIVDGVIEEFRVDPTWLDDAPVERVEGLIRDTVNACLEEFNQQSLAQLTQELPDMQALGAAFTAADAKLEQAFTQALLDAKVR